MTDLFNQVFSKLTTTSVLLMVLDILVVSFLIYRVLLLIRGTRAAQMVAGLVLIGVGYLASQRFELGTLGWLLDKFWSAFLILVIVVFQADIRRGLSTMGRGVFLARRRREELYLVEEVIRAVERMARRRIGAIIVFERVAGLDEFIQPGTVLEAQVTRDLLMTIFRVDAENPIHDGAVIIRNLRIYQAGALLPLSQNTELERSLGTRHRAGLGITEETDAVAVVVSEERGAISVCSNGRIVQNLSGEELRTTLLSMFGKPKRGKAEEETAGAEAEAEGEGLSAETAADAGSRR